MKVVPRHFDSLLRPGARTALSVRTPEGERADLAVRAPGQHARGVALVITLILISVITFLAITFLALARRERGQVSTTLEQSTAQFAADTARERAVAEVLANIIGHNNSFDFGLLVSTNYINRFGFDPAGQPLGPNLTNINFEYTINGAALTPAQQQANLANLLFNPRPPVFVTNHLAGTAGSNEFRFYLDLNRDGRYTPNGLLVVTNQAGNFYNPNGTERARYRFEPNDWLQTNVLQQFFTGDPEFIGVLQRPEFPHSPSNQFVARYAFLVQPIGKSLDGNFIHNDARLPDPDMAAAAGDGFRRNQGVGTWENNLASFLVDLNTNAWPLVAGRPLGTRYQYFPDGANNLGAAFDDALSLLRYRYAGDANKYVWSFAAVYPGLREVNMWNDHIDAYCLSPLASNLFGLSRDDDQKFTTVTPWSGSDNPNHLFSGQDFFNLNKMPALFVNRLKAAQSYIEPPATVPSSYSTYTYYRLIEQLGTDSAPEPEEKLNVNYVNVGGLRATNFVAWNDPDLINGNPARGIPAFRRPGSEVFFTNAVDRLVRKYTADWLARDRRGYTNLFGTNVTFAGGSIPVLVNGHFTYTPALHRLLQVAANIYDAVYPTNDFARPPNQIRRPLPTVFRPIFNRVGNDIYIQDFKLVDNLQTINFSKLVDVGISNSIPTVEPDSLIFGVPFVVAARQGLPNFNEFASESVFQITRKVELVKTGNKITQTNQMFDIGISNVFGAEVWNSYVSNFPGPVTVSVTNFFRVSLTNDLGFVFNTNLIAYGQSTILGSSSWPAWKEGAAGASDASFLVPLRSNHITIPDSVYRVGANQFRPQSGEFERPSGYTFPRWGFAVTNRVLAVISDTASGKIFDFVLLGGLNGQRNLTDEMASRFVAGQEFKTIWATNSPDGVHLGDMYGIINQILISAGENKEDGNWQNYAISAPLGPSKYDEIAKFKAFYSPNNQASVTDENRIIHSAINTDDHAYTPFNPTWKQSLSLVWQANDPLVHYLAGDMEDIQKSGELNPWTPPSRNTNSTLANLGALNERYKPWGGNPIKTGGGSSTVTDANAFNPAFKDPGVRGPKYWQFPTNKLPTLGWLGRVHRGTPWQTIYLKSTSIPESKLDAAWRFWAGNRLVDDAENNQPQTDRVLFDVFTTALNENATRGQLSINQTNLAAWSAVFGGMLMLQNTNTDSQLVDNNGWTGFGSDFISPAGNFDLLTTNTFPAMVKLVEGINRTRANTNLFRNQTFQYLGDILATPELTLASPFINHGTFDDEGHNYQRELGMTDALVEWLPQQMMSLVRLGEPRFVVYAYGQSLKPAPQSIQMSGPYFNLCTNYQITAETVTRTVVRIEGAPDKPRAVIESYNVLPPD